MRALLLALMLSLCASATAQRPASLSDAQAEGLMALARIHGVVRYFHPSDSLDRVDWPRFLVHASDRMASVARADEVAPRLEELFGPIVEGFRVVPRGTAAVPPQGEGPAVEWRHLGYGLEGDRRDPFASWRTHHPPVGMGGSKGSYFQHRAEAQKSAHADPVMRIPVGAGLEAHVPVSLPLSAAKVGDAQRQRLEKLSATLAAVAPRGREIRRAEAYADGIAAWNVAAHFYPYWPVVKVDWEAALRDWLVTQRPVQSRAQLRDSLRALMAPLDDGQLEIVDPQAAPAWLPVSVRLAGGRWIVDASAVADVKRGDVLATIDGRPAAQWFADRFARVSGSPQVKPWRARLDLLSGERGAPLLLELVRDGKPVVARLVYSAASPLEPERLPPIQELHPGIHYVDLSRFDPAAFAAARESLSAARGIVFDARGVPAAGAVEVVPYWITQSDGAQWMFVPRFDVPFAKAGAAWSIGWQRPREAALAKPVKVLLVDGRTHGYAESLAAYFPAQKTGPLVGEATAGANGNVARATLPSGLQLVFTSMRVMRHDGTSYHREGLQPDVLVRPTAEGVRDGRDEALARAIRLIEKPTPPG